jgi:hypothetical protein
MFWSAARQSCIETCRSLLSFRRFKILYKCPYNSQILVGMKIAYVLHETLNLATFMVFMKLKHVTGERVESAGRQADRCLSLDRDG